MKYLQCNETLDVRYCEITARTPYSSAPAFGEPALPLLRERSDEVMQLQLDETAAGLELPDRVANVDDLLVLRQACADAIVSTHELGPHELIPAVLINTKGRTHSEDYVVVNPLGSFDCLDTSRSEMGGTPDDPYVRIGGSFCFDSARVPPGRDIFRADKIAAGYAYSDRLHDFVISRAFTNFVFREVPVR